MSAGGSGDPFGAWVERVAATGRIPGAAWWVEDGRGAVWSGAGGHLSGKASPAARIERPYDLASLTKPLATAPLLLLLAREGTLDLDEPAAVRLPELGDAPVGRVPLRRLATHEGGLPAWRPLYLEAPRPTLDGFVEVIATASRAGGDHSPAATLYSDLGYLVLGAALERASATPLDRLFAERIAGPLGLSRIGFARDGAGFEDAAPTERGNVYERVLSGAAASDSRLRSTTIRGAVHDANAWALGGVAGHAGLFGTVGDVAALARELLRPRVLPLDPADRAALLEASSADGRRSVGFELARASSAARGILPDTAPGHTGFTGTSLWLDPPRGGLALLLSNRVHPVVDSRPFQPVRRAFHRLVRRLTVASRG